MSHCISRALILQKSARPLGDANLSKNLIISTSCVPQISYKTPVDGPGQERAQAAYGRHTACLLQSRVGGASAEREVRAFNAHYCRRSDVPLSRNKRAATSATTPTRSLRVALLDTTYSFGAQRVARLTALSTSRPP